jgi:hypothetical protein
MSVDDIKLLIDSPLASERAAKTLQELALIGIVAHFESFLKNQFAALINICPELLAQFSSKRGNLSIEIGALLRIRKSFEHRLGSLVAEQFDFGAAKKINGLFLDLVGITPLSKDEEGEYTRLLNDRNLLVHHGGIVTIKYETPTDPSSDRAHFDSLRVSRGDVAKWVDFVDAIARKTVLASYNEINKIIEASKWVLQPSQEDAVFMLLMNVPEAEKMNITSPRAKRRAAEQISQNTKEERNTRLKRKRRNSNRGSARRNNGQI